VIQDILTSRRLQFDLLSTWYTSEVLDIKFVAATSFGSQSSLSLPPSSSENLCCAYYKTRRPASADRTARAANFRRDL